MSKQFTLTYDAYSALVAVTPSFPLLSWYVDQYDSTETIEVSVEKFEVPASQSTDYTLPVRTDSRTALSIIACTDSLTTATSGGITAKLNGGSTYWPIKPRWILSQDVTALVVKNTATAAKELIVVKVLISGTPIYIESAKIA